MASGLILVTPRVHAGDTQEGLACGREAGAVLDFPVGHVDRTF